MTQRPDRPRRRYSPRQTWTPEQIAQARRMLDLGASARQVDAAHGRSSSSGYHTIVQRFEHRPAARGDTRLWEVFEGLPQDVQAWVAAQIPPGGRTVDLVRAIIIDAYHDARG